MKFIYTLFFFFSSSIVFSCDCPPIQQINAEKLKIYNVIFYGGVDSVSSCSDEGIGKAYFTIIELYKGQVEKKVVITFDCSSSCMMSFSKGEKWLIYSVYKKFKILAVHFCEHSRKFFENEKQDVYLITSQQSFEDEKKYLTTNLGIQPFIEKNRLNEEQALLKPHNNQPSGINKIILLCISLVAMLIVYFITRKKKRND